MSLLLLFNQLAKKPAGALMPVKLAPRRMPRDNRLQDDEVIIMLLAAYIKQQGYDYEPDRNNN